MSIAIKVSNLSKKYLIGIKKAADLRSQIHAIFQFNAKSQDDFMALNDISFEINKGEVVGIIGKNGAGKSTLLKILSQITRPSSGIIEINGRIASLLEVGTGFHPELTGRENIFLNGTILGMTRKEVATKFDEIVAFSGIEKFIDTPVKHYSSGMYVRLAFAVAAHLEPEILIIDEVLAVGDAEFQKKCLGKMQDVAKHGRTVIFVSHDLGAVMQLCTKCLLLVNGKNTLFGPTKEVIQEYNKLDYNGSNAYINKNGLIKKVTILNADVGNITFDDDIIIEIEIDPNNLADGTLLGVSMLDNVKRKIFTTHSTIKEFKHLYKMRISKETFYSGEYSFDVAIYQPNLIVNDYVYDICKFEIVDFTSTFSKFSAKEIGFLNLAVEWE